jgi:hypothetical protein
MHATPPGWSAVSMSRACSWRSIWICAIFEAEVSSPDGHHPHRSAPHAGDVATCSAQFASHIHGESAHGAVRRRSTRDQLQRRTRALHMALRRWPSGWSCDSNGADLACIKVGRFQGPKSWLGTAADCDRKRWSKSVPTEDGNCVASKASCYRGKLRHPRCRLSLSRAGRMHLENMTV